jgi:hypothetical protein
VRVLAWADKILFLLALIVLIDIDGSPAVDPAETPSLSALLLHGIRSDLPMHCTKRFLDVTLRLSAGQLKA